MLPAAFCMLQQPGWKPVWLFATNHPRQSSNMQGTATTTFQSLLVVEGYICSVSFSTPHAAITVLRQQQQQQRASAVDISARRVDQVPTLSTLRTSIWNTWTWRVMFLLEWHFESAAADIARYLLVVPCVLCVLPCCAVLCLPTMTVRDSSEFLRRSSYAVGFAVQWPVDLP